MNVDNLKKARENAHFTQLQAAEKLGISDGTYKNYEQGKREPNNEILLNIANLFGVTTDYLLGREPLEKGALDRLAEEHRMSALEKKIVDGYLKLDPKMRDDLMEFLHKSVREVMSEDNPPEASEQEQEQETITTIRAARSDDDHPPEVIETTKDFSKFPPTDLKL